MNDSRLTLPHAREEPLCVEYEPSACCSSTGTHVPGVCRDGTSGSHAQKVCPNDPWDGKDDH